MLLAHLQTQTHTSPLVLLKVLTLKVLDTTFEDVVRTVQEQEGTFNEQIALEAAILEPFGIF